LDAGIILTTDKVDLVRDSAQKISELLKKGVLIKSSYIKYIFSDLTKVKSGMLEVAIINAKTAAETIAQNSASTLNGIRSANQGMFAIESIDSSGSESSSIMKKVRVVTSLEYYLK
jgi:hypothetical protein